MASCATAGDADDGVEEEVRQTVEALVHSVAAAVTEYVLVPGREHIQYSVNSRQQRQLQLRNRTAQVQYISFFGRCYHCKYLGHSQKYCPLRLCKRCQRYGHGEYACWKDVAAHETKRD